ncbi:MAG: hypothetical protein OXQ89_14585 [Rhodospirillaceae bacterium]|nr:hypothetical protein [Rhodospirillaceae bacterium]MDE0360377.1 hypothetical protein [Rhodospirillaceae bacterium]
MPETRDLVFPDEPRRILEGVEEWLLKHFPKRALVIGGGTVLASRWSHRVSTDCDMFADEWAFREVGFDALRRDVDARLLSGDLIRARLSPRTLFIESSDGELAIVGDSSQQPRHPTDRIAGMSVHPVGEILRRKMEYRLISRGFVEARDLYDFAVAACTETKEMEWVMWGVGESVAAGVEAGLRQSMEMGGKQLIKPHCPDLAHDLGGFAVQLFRVGPVEFNRRHGEMIRRGLPLERKGNVQ